MKSPDHIERLFEDENLPPPEAEEGLRRLDLTPSAEALGAAKKKKINWEERREFTRAEVAPDQIHLSFSNDQQFAKQYIENFSLGGLFVRTKLRPGVGAIVPIEFSVPLHNFEARIFKLRAKVCRETENGLGLQFLDLDQETRADLEVFVKTILPSGSVPMNQVKRSSRERLDQLREARQSTQEKQKSFLLRGEIEQQQSGG